MHLLGRSVLFSCYHFVLLSFCLSFLLSVLLSVHASVFFSQQLLQILDVIENAETGSTFSHLANEVNDEKPPPPLPPPPPPPPPKNEDANGSEPPNNDRDDDAPKGDDMKGVRSEAKASIPII